MEELAIGSSYRQWYGYQPKHKIEEFQSLTFQECNFISLE